MTTDYSPEIIADMKDDFCAILRRIKRPNANIEGLITKLSGSDFFRAPASTKYHNNVAGGLVAHSQSRRCGSS